MTNDDHALLIKLHHLITDGWSQRLFWEELEALYNAGSKGLPAKLPELPFQYRHFVEWQRAWLRTPAAEEQLNYWRGRLEGLTELPLRTDRPRPETWTGRGARLPLKLSRTLSGGIKSLSRTHNATLFMTLLAAFQCLLYRYTQHDDIAVGSLIANRNQIEIRATHRDVRKYDRSPDRPIRRSHIQRGPAACPASDVGCLSKPGPADRRNSAGTPSAAQLGSESLVSGDVHSAKGIFDSAWPSTDCPRASVDVDPGIARSDLLLELIDEDGRLGGWLEYSTELFEAATIARMAAHFRTLLESIVANPEQRISRLPLLPVAERKQVVVDWNPTETAAAPLEHFLRTLRQAGRAHPRRHGGVRRAGSAQLP